MRCFKFQFCSSDCFIFNLVYVSSGLLQAFPLCIPTHTCNNSLRAVRRDPWNLWCFMIVLKYSVSPHFCLSLVHRGRFYEIESQIHHVPGCLMRRCAFHCLPGVPFSRYSFLLEIPVNSKEDPKASYSPCLWNDRNSVAFLTSQWSKHLHNHKRNCLFVDNSKKTGLLQTLQKRSLRKWDGNKNECLSMKSMFI